MLFLLDGNTYFPVMFVANRGFMLSLFFRLLCFYEHHQWRSTKSRSALVPGCTSLNVQRTDDKTLVIQSQAPNLFACDDVGPVHLAYLCRFGNFIGNPRCKKGDRYELGSLTVEVLESDASDLASRVAFRFDTSLDSPGFHWLRFDREKALASSQAYQPFKIPAIGRSVTLSGPSRRADSEGKKLKNE